MEGKKDQRTRKYLKEGGNSVRMGTFPHLWSVIQGTQDTNEAREGGVVLWIDWPHRSKMEKGIA